MMDCPGRGQARISGCRLSSRESCSRWRGRRAHFSLALDGDPAEKDTTFEVGGIPFVADAETATELPSVEIDFVETVWTKGFTIRNVDHDCGAHMMQ